MLRAQELEIQDDDTEEDEDYNDHFDRMVNDHNNQFMSVDEIGK